MLTAISIYILIGLIMLAALWTSFDKMTPGLAFTVVVAGPGIWLIGKILGSDKENI